MQGGKSVTESIGEIQLENNFLQEEIEKLQRRERELLSELQRKK